MILLGTHNSLSYLPCQWYFRPFAWVGRCQSLCIEEQYNSGVRYFDIRVKYVDGKAISGHGLLTYKIDIDDVLFKINCFRGCIVRLFLENSKRNPTKDFERFSADIKIWADKYLGIRFVEGGCRHTYKRFIADNIPERRCYWSKGDSIIPYPKAYAKGHNKVFHTGDNEEIYSIYDFIQF